MEKKPVNIVVHDAREGARRLNEIVESGGFNFDIGINEEYVTTVTKHSDGTSSEEKEKVFRIIGFVDTYVGNELDSLNAVREDLKNIKKEREEMNRTLNVMNKSAFAPISIFLLIIALLLLTFGILTLAKILPLPAGQIPIAIVLVIVGTLALGGSIALFITRLNKKKALLANKDEIINKDNDLRNREAEIDSRTPSWYKNALWSYEGNTLRNASHRLTLKK